MRWNGSTQDLFDRIQAEDSLALDQLFLLHPASRPATVSAALGMCSTLLPTLASTSYASPTLASTSYALLSTPLAPPRIKWERNSLVRGEVSSQKQVLTAGVMPRQRSRLQTRKALARVATNNRAVHCWAAYVEKNLDNFLYEVDLKSSFRPSGSTWQRI